MIIRENDTQECLMGIVNTETDCLCDRCIEAILDDSVLELDELERDQIGREWWWDQCQKYGEPV